MARYRCCFLNEDDRVVRIEELDSYDDRDAHRDAMSLMVKTGRFSGYELWRDGRKVDEYRQVKPRGTADPRCDDDLEAQLCGLAPADELAYRYLYRPNFAHCRRDPLGKARIAELEGQLDADGRARALALAADLTWTLMANTCSDRNSEHLRVKPPHRRGSVSRRFDAADELCEPYHLAQGWVPEAACSSDSRPASAGFSFAGAGSGLPGATLTSKPPHHAAKSVRASLQPPPRL